MAMELSASKWGLAFSNEEKVRQVVVMAGDRAGLLAQVQRAKEKLGLSADAAVICCYEAGRDGFWIHRFLDREGIRNHVVDAASIEVNRRKRRVKTDRVDAESLVRMLMRYEKGERTLWRTAKVPSEAEEDERRLHREIQRLKKERTSHSNRIRGLLVLQGVRLGRGAVAALAVDRLRTWEGKALPAALGEELRRECDRLRVLEDQIKALEKTQAERIKTPQTASDRVAGRLSQLRGVGPVSSWILSKEFFGWRTFRNRREVGALAGLTGTPYCSGSSERDQGISKAGNVRVRWVMIELSWRWLQFQPASALSKWFWDRFGRGNGRTRRIGIVALARKLLVALWKYLDHGEIPQGAVLKAA
ncbi:MAG TPA: IS110 family transposase [Kiritimatiellia bacterium]|nr:IS110 family transposase [Kiritimatiellia bacterium]